MKLCYGTLCEASCFAPLEKGCTDAIRNRYARDVV